MVGISTITDPYQPVEVGEKLTRKSIEVLLKRGFTVSIQTKSTLVLRDLDLLTSRREAVDVGFTIITADPSTSSLLEPGAPRPAQRAEALRTISSTGVKTWLFYGPVIPGLNDSAESFRGVLELVGNCVELVFVDKLRITPRVRISLSSALENFEKISSTVRDRYWWSRVVNSFSEVCAKLGVRCVASIAEPLAGGGRVLNLSSFRGKRLLNVERSSQG
ncbi:MAG: hypothetical protein RMH84_01705 [Sulfolobales archaeon]|nr:hypothetical protein [Sulfolobales archaeon]